MQPLNANDSGMMTKSKGEVFDRGFILRKRNKIIKDLNGNSTQF